MRMVWQFELTDDEHGGLPGAGGGAEGLTAAVVDGGVVHPLLPLHLHIIADDDAMAA
jgi:hypothetical protein